MPRFSVKRLLASITAVAIGLSMIAGMIQIMNAPVHIRQLIPILWLGSGALIGAGVLAPFRWTLVGAAIGFILQGAFGVYIAMNFHPS